MKFIVRKGSDPVGKADAALLTALGLPGGGIVSLGKTHVLISPGETTSPTAIMLGERTMANAGVSVGDTVDVKRALLPTARRVVISRIDAEIDARHLARSLQGIPASVGDRVEVQVGYGKEKSATSVEVEITSVEPEPSAVISSGTVVHEAGEDTQDLVAQPTGSPAGEELTTARALLAGLQTEVEVMTGWLSLLTAPGDLPEVWGLPKVAGVLVEGPSGCGKSEIVAAAAETVGASVHEVSLELVFKPQKLLELLEKAVKNTPRPAVIFLDRLDAVVGDDALFRNQVAAIMRWF